MENDRSKLQRYYSKSRHDGNKVRIVWKDINYSILAKDPKKSTFIKPVYTNKRILQDINGQVESGTLLAIMGPTGCGKTSLLNVLAARLSSVGKESSQLTGDVFVNGKLRNDSTFRRITGYVLQVMN
jgi:ATP-binding cassette subfamily G (WHITE) protein 2